MLLVAICRVENVLVRFAVHFVMALYLGVI